MCTVSDQVRAGMTLPTIIERDPVDITHIWEGESPLRLHIRRAAFRRVLGTLLPAVEIV